MCIAQAVGEGGVNNRADTKVVQALLNENLGRLIPYAPLQIDGVAGALMRSMIGELQTRVLKMGKPDRKVAPGSATLKELRAGMKAGLTIYKLQAIMTGASLSKINQYLPALQIAIAANEINTPLRIAHFLAQVGHESVDLQFTEELATGAAYEGREKLGNTQPGDGVRFKGRGLIQLTGRANYTAFGKARNHDYITGSNNLLLSSNPNVAVDVSCWFWTKHDLNRFADADNVREITHIINGGYNGLPSRLEHLQRAKCLLVP